MRKLMYAQTPLYTHPHTPNSHISHIYPPIHTHKHTHIYKPYTHINTHTLSLSLTYPPTHPLHIHTPNTRTHAHTHIGESIIFSH